MRVKNLVTGLEHDVPPGHWSLASPDYELVEPEPKLEPEPTPEPKRGKKK